MNIINHIPLGHDNAVTRRQLCELTGLSDRKIRDLIFQERRNTPILNLQDGKGYFIPTEEETELVARFVSQETARLKSIGWALKSARRFLNG